MNILKLAWKNIIHNPLSLLLNLLLLTLGIGLINFILLLDNQLKDKFDKNLAGIDLVIGAKGSPLQLILSSMYHIDAPTGNITIKEAKPFLREGHPLIKTAVPLSMGDSYKGYRIIGTDYSMLDLYGAELSEGSKWSDTYEVTAGADVADKLHLKIGSKFKSSHGFNDDEDLEHGESTFVIVGILAPTSSVIDQLLLCSTKSVWDVHKHQGGDYAMQDTSATKPVFDMSRASLLSFEEEDITSILIQYVNKTNFQALSMPRNINENTDLQAASPAYEINRLYDMMGTGTKALQLLAVLIAIVSAISIFVSLINSLRQRKYELSLLRVLGGKPRSLFALIILEGVIMSILGFILGMVFSHIAMTLLGDSLSEKYNYDFRAWETHGKELYLLIVSISLGFLAAFIPAILAYGTDIHKNLSQG
jgi:putative ABC transport system permease protein